MMLRRSTCIQNIIACLLALGCKLCLANSVDNYDKNDHDDSSAPLNGDCPVNNDKYLPPADIPTVILRNGVELPLFSLGTAHVAMGVSHGVDNQTFTGFFPAMAYRQVELALQKGIRSFDTALMYGTQPHLGQVLGAWWAAGRLTARSNIFITTKVFHKPAPKFGLKRNHLADMHHMTPEQVALQTEDHVELCLKELQMGYIDLMLLHWPSGEGHDETMARQRRLAAWKVL
jgi:diketogulonate reductase-like aldo/keto reductase